MLDYILHFQLSQMIVHYHFLLKLTFKMVFNVFVTGDPPRPSLVTPVVNLPKHRDSEGAPKPFQTFPNLPDPASMNVSDLKSLQIDFVQRL